MYLFLHNLFEPFALDSVGVESGGKGPRVELGFNLNTVLLPGQSTPTWGAGQVTA